MSKCQPTIHNAEMVPSHRGPLSPGLGRPTWGGRGTVHLEGLSQASCPSLADSAAGSLAPWGRNFRVSEHSPGQGLSSLLLF